MRLYFIQYIDAIITTILGLYFTIYAYRHRERLQTNSQKLVRILPVLAPLVLVFGLLRFAMDSQQTYVWHRVYSEDKQASVEFPLEAKSETVADVFQGVSLRRFTVQCDIPYRGINLRLSYNEIPGEQEGATLEQRIGGLKFVFEQQGFTILSCIEERYEDVRYYRIIVEKDHEKIRISTRVTVTPKAVYRAMVTSSSGFHEEPSIVRFLDSFKLEHSGPQKNDGARQKMGTGQE